MQIVQLKIPTYNEEGFAVYITKTMHIIQQGFYLTISYTFSPIKSN